MKDYAKLIEHINEADRLTEFQKEELKEIRNSLIIMASEVAKKSARRLLAMRSSRKSPSSSQKGSKS